MNFANLGTGKIERLVGDPGRYSLEHVYLDVERGHLAATNGCALVLSTVITEPEDVSGYITAAALLAYRAALLKVPSWQTKHRVRFQALRDELIITNAEGETQTFRRPNPGTFPNYAAVMPTDRDEKPALALDFEMLRKLVESLGYPETLSGRSSMIAFFPGKDVKDSVVVKTSENGPIGIIMPIRITEDKWLTTIDQLDARRAELLSAAKAAEDREQRRDSKEPDHEDAAENERTHYVGMDGELHSAVVEETDDEDDEEEDDENEDDLADAEANFPIDRSAILPLPLSEEDSGGIRLVKGGDSAAA